MAEHLVWQAGRHAGRDRAAAKLAPAHEFIDKLPQGCDTVVGQGGQALSGGQRQRIGIARAFVRAPAILILDEPSSGLDTESERLVFEGLGRLLEGKTTFIIAHRLATVRKADIILVMDDGRIVEQGAHEELLGRAGMYSALQRVQDGHQWGASGEDGQPRV